MFLRTRARDCLYLNWAIPASSAPELPAPLRYEIHHCDDTDWIFVSALLFRFSGLHPRNLPLLRLSYPQMNLRLYVLDGDDVPSVLFLRIMVPFWVAPVSRFVGRQPASSGRFDYPSPSREPLNEAWHWQLSSKGSLDVIARPGVPAFGAGPDLGSWRRTVDYFRRRPKGYVQHDGQLREITRSHPQVEVVPLKVEVNSADLISATFDSQQEEHWQRPHSAWLCPEVPFVFELGKPMKLPLSSPSMAVAESSLPRSLC